MPNTGPPYPPTIPGSNAIGKFQIGISPVGTMIPFNWWTTVISQYANSPVLTTLLGDFDSYIDQTQNFDAFYDDIWNINTAQGYGLDVWGRIVGVNRVLKVQVGKNFGFEEAGTISADPFNQSPFYGGSRLTDNFSLSDSSYRTLIFAKAAANITNGSIAAINRILMNLFPNRGNAFVVDTVKVGLYFGFQEATDAQPFNQAPFYAGQPFSTMTMEYVFEFQLTPVELAIVQNSGVLPKSVGVFASIFLTTPANPP